jgi:serine phosphatase RsbU (regulator of sigma subunit)
MEKQVLMYAGAGHPPILYWASPTEGVKDLLENGTILGMFDFATYNAVEMPISPGAWCLMYTDGIPETTNPQEVQFGDERFRTFLGEQKWASADLLADGLLAELSRWSGRAPGEDPEDDITMVAIRITALRS